MNNKTPYSHKRTYQLFNRDQLPSKVVLNDIINGHAVRTTLYRSKMRKGYAGRTEIGGIHYQSPLIIVADNKITMELGVNEFNRIVGEFSLKEWGPQYLHDIGVRLMVNKYQPDKLLPLSQRSLLRMLEGYPSEDITDTVEYACQRMETSLPMMAAGLPVVVYKRERDTDQGYHQHVLIKATGVVLTGKVTGSRFKHIEEGALPFEFNP